MLEDPEYDVAAYLEVASTPTYLAQVRAAVKVTINRVATGVDNNTPCPLMPSSGSTHLLQPLTTLTSGTPTNAW